MLAGAKQLLDTLRRSTSRDDTFGANDTAAAASLLRVAERMRRIFQLPVPDAPRLFLVGGEVDGAAFHPSWEGPPISATGIGLDLFQAVRSCVCEGVEFLSQLARFENTLVSGRPDELPNAISPEALRQLVAMAGLDWSAEAPQMHWTEGKSVLGGTPVLLPAALCYRNVQNPDKSKPRIKLSAGCGAASTVEAALTHALLELVERDAIALWWLGGRPASQPATDVPLALRMQTGRERSTRRTWLLDITTDLAVPCIAALSIDAEGRGLVCGFAARLDYADAMRAAIFEMCQMEVGLYLILLKRRQSGDGALSENDRKYLRRAFGFQIRDCALLVPSDNTASGRLPTQQDTIKSLDDLSLRLASRSIEAFWVDLTRSDMGIPAVRALAPSLQPYPSDIVTPRLQHQIDETGGGFGRTSGIDLM